MNAPSDNVDIDPLAAARLARLTAARWRGMERVLGLLVIGVCISLVCVFALKPVAVSAIVPRATGYRMDVNRAEVATLMLLPGIGRPLAERMVAERDRVGEWRKLTELRRVKGIGVGTLGKIGPWVRLVDDRMAGPAKAKDSTVD